MPNTTPPTEDRDWKRELGWKHKEACADGRSCVCEIGYVGDLITTAEARGREHVASWIRSYAPRVCANDVMGNERPGLADMIVGEGLIDQALTPKHD